METAKNTGTLQKKNELLWLQSDLLHMDVRRIEMEFVGSDDSGGLRDTKFYDAEGRELDAYSINDRIWQLEESGKNKEKKSLLMSAYDEVFKFPNWEVNEGSKILVTYQVAPWGIFLEGATMTALGYDLDL